MERIQPTSRGKENKEEQNGIQQKVIQQREETFAVEQEPKETLQNEERNLAELLNYDEEEDVNTARRSERARIPTEKMLAYREDEQSKREKRLLSLYEHWKAQARITRHDLKSELTDKQLAHLADNLEKRKHDLMKLYDELRAHGMPDTELRRKVDACAAVTGDIIKILNERLTGVNGDYDAEYEGERLRELRKPHYARSIFGSSASEPTSSHHSTHPSVAAKRTEAAAELAAKQAEYKMLSEEKRQKEKIRAIEEEHRRELDEHKAELERLMVKKDLSAAQARFEVYDKEVKEESESQFTHVPLPFDSNPPAATRPSTVASSAPVDVTSLAQAIQDSIAINKLPTPEPTVFNGNPIDFVEWKNSFMSLIDGKKISPADKLHYLKRYVGGAAHKCLEGTFYRSDSDAYSDAWSKLNQRYGQPFTIQRAFREKLSNWPKIQSKDAEGLRNFSDYLNTCVQAMPHVKGLNILNDCEENQKLVRKVPDWIASGWNRQVTARLREGKDFPSFEEFANFMSMEAETACNPVTSFSALHSAETNQEKLSTRVSKGNKVSALNTQTVVENDPQTSTTQEKVKPPCMLCQDINHQLSRCPDFLQENLEHRKTYIKENRLCYGCLKPGHGAKECRHRHTCDSCKGRHPTCLHDDNYKEKAKRENPAQRSEGMEPTPVRSLNVTNQGQSENSSMIVPVWVSDYKSPSTEKLVYALLDTQSDTTFIEHDLSEELQLTTCPVKLKLTTMMGENVVFKSERTSGLRVRGFNSTEYIDLPPAYTKDCIPVNREHIPTHETAKRWRHFAAIADQIPPLLSCEVGLLIGYNCPRSLIPRRVITGTDDEPFAILTDLGWSIVGCSAPHSPQQSNRHCHRVTVKELPAVTPMDAIRILETDFSDTQGNDKTVSQEDLNFLEKLKENIMTNEHGHYEMPLPFRERPYLPDNKQLAAVRLSHLKRKFNANESYKNDYTNYMMDLIDRGDAEVCTEGNDGEKWYIPHHGVYHPKKPGKLRVVFDCSARYKGSSLNDHLLTGPDMINNLTGVLIRFRQHHIALMCDIEKMFHQFHVSEKDRDYLRFLWWENDDLSTPPSEYRMKVHLFGAVSSPGCANYGLKQLAKEHSHTHPFGSQFIARDFYVDDGVASVESVEKAIQIAKEARELCAERGLRLHKFMSNNSAVLQSIPSTERATDINAKSLTLNDTALERALGINWNVESDCFTFKVTPKNQPATRRGILSSVASVYDPLGFVAPYVLIGKKILQEMCHQGTGWDDPIPEHLKPRWEKWQEDLGKMERIHIPRCYQPSDFGKVIKTELHHFSDASTTGYGQCTYLRQKNERGDIHCALLMGKARVSPLKVTTIPRLELTAAVVSVTVSNMLKEELSYSGVEEFFWTDSRVVLGYINNEARRFHTFVANRVQKIRHDSDPNRWFHVPTGENPADYTSRGKTVEELLSSDWFTGPSFLWEKEIEMPTEVPTELPVGDPEVKKAHTFQTKSSEEHANLAERLEKFSSWSQAIKAVARLLRRARKVKSCDLSTVEERQSAERLIIKDIQSQAYGQEIKLLSKGHQLPRHSKLHSLDAFLDPEGVLKVGGRLSRSSFQSTFKHPTVIPPRHHMTNLIIGHHHERVKHQGKGFTINAIRSGGYWICGLSRAVATYIRHCVTCRRLRRPVEEQRMSDLPVERTEPTAPFTYCGMDCFGPFLTKQGRKQEKRYGLLFTCFCSRAIHIEMLEDLSTDTFINGLRCFIALRGAVRQIKCDQGTNFMGARNELKAALKELDTDRLNTFLSEKQCDFVTNAPHASHAGGVWERQIRTVRSVLDATLLLAPDRLSDASLRTFFYETMAIVNSRPLTVDTLNSPDSLEPLTPNHLITMKSIAALPPPGKFEREDLYGRKRWRQVQYLTEQFWSRWKREYLHSISTRQCWHSTKRNLQVGDVVMDTDDTLPRSQWRLGSVSEVTQSKDGLVRRVKILLGDKGLNHKGQRINRLSIVERPVQKLVLLLEAV